MKKISVIVFLSLSFLFISCSNINGNQKKNKLKIERGKNKAQNDKAKPELLTYNEFLKKVWNFEKNPHKLVYEGKEPIVIDFYADWCGPCKKVAPIMVELAEKYENKVKFYKINVDKERKLASVFRIRSIPSVLFLSTHGKPQIQVGLLPREQYIKTIDKQLREKEQSTEKK